ncbi:unnamed protein product [Adineta steineri]|uniref:Uncharacterized protein n=2 Tax=Adineta steineri TaxID=433720 RepID=A0A819RZK2_9BILA|nr:unnamed protein product [Adineta steineri]CAF1396447.1 unnamed protein product [Adineta steineri]CAF4053612.1 unnamed protein product [Adineta steineri]CAF4080924.1 unnamed protein product [Adineta steineri]
MAKLLYFALMFMCMSGVASAHGGAKDSFISILQYFIPSVSICTNATGYWNLATTNINACQANATCNAVLVAREPNTVAFFGSPTNKALATSNCATFAANLVTAITADSTAECARQKIFSTLVKQIRQAAHTATGSIGKNELDVNGSGECHH